MTGIRAASLNAVGLLRQIIHVVGITRKKGKYLSSGLKRNVRQKIRIMAGNAIRTILRFDELIYLLIKYISIETRKSMITGV
jgi:hypothetical protein